MNEPMMNEFVDMEFPNTQGKRCGNQITLVQKIWCANGASSSLTVPIGYWNTRLFGYKDEWRLCLSQFIYTNESMAVQMIFERGG